jgi:translation elongation factor EF-Tu-like GTPase
MCALLLRSHRSILGSLLLIGMSVSVVHAGPSIALIGDEHRGVILRQIAAEERSGIQRRGEVYELVVESVGLRLSTLAPGGSVTSLADLLHVNDIALIVVDSTRGPVAAIREHVLVARQARVPMLAVLLANVKSLYEGAPHEAAELLGLEGREIRELLSTYDLHGDAAPIFHDARTPEPSAPAAAYGTQETLRALSRFTPRRVTADGMQSASEIWGAVYLLTEAEADGHAVSLTPDDSVIVWSEGTQSRAKLASTSSYHPGDFREMPLAMEQPIRSRDGSRILLVSGDRVVGLGAITQIGP